VNSSPDPGSASSPRLERGVLGEVALGTAPLAFRDVSREDAIATIRTAVDAGVRLIDTALAYNRPGSVSWSEETVRDALAGMPGDARPLVATKGGHWRDGDGFPVDGRPQTLRANCLTSLRSLGVERLDLYFLHHVDPHVPLAESVGALDALRREGLIAAIGLSNVSVEQLDVAQGIAPVAAVQNRLSVLERDDAVTARRCAELGVLYLAYQPFGGGGGAIDAHPALRRIAAAHGVAPHRVALAWLAAVSPAVVALVGSTRAATILDSLAASGLRLDADELAELSA
jgi:pyridoxine 4-dehydrogenase